MQKVSSDYGKARKKFGRAMQRVKKIRQAGGKLAVVRGAKKDIRSIKKTGRRFQSAMMHAGASGQMQKHGGEPAEGLKASEVIAYAETARALTEAYVKVHAAAAKAPVRASADMLRKARKIRKQKKAMEIAQIMAAAPSPWIKKETPRIKKAEISFRNTVKSDYRPGTPMRVVTKPVYKGEIASRNGAIYDVSKLERLYKVHGCTVSVKGVHGTGGEVRGVHPRGGEKPKIDHTPKELKEPSKAEKVKAAEKQTGVKSKNHTDNLEKKQASEKKHGKHKGKADKGGKQKKSGKNSVAKDVAKRYIVEQMLLNGGDENCSSGVEAAVGNIIVGKAGEIVQKAVSSIFKMAGKATQKLLQVIIGVVFYLTKTLIQSIIIVLGALLGPAVMTFLPVISIAVGGMYLIGGFFLSFTESGEFAVTAIESHVSGIMEISKGYDEVRIHPTRSSESNYDDMLLVYLSKVADVEDDADLEGDAPFLWIDKRAERKAINTVLDSMCYYVTGSYKKPYAVAVYLKDAKGNYVRDEDGQLIVVGYTTKYKTITTFDLYLEDAEDYFRDHREKNRVKENYEILLDFFTDLGYRPNGGRTICDTYGY